MKKNIKNYIVYMIIGIIFCFILFSIIKKYDFDGNTVNRIISNKYYLIFLFLSIILCFGLQGKTDNKSKFLIYLILFINCLYLFFLFLLGNIGLTNTQGLIILGLLILGFTGIFIKNWFGYTIIGLSLIGSLIILYFSIIPLYNEGPDFEGFEKIFEEKLLIYSIIDINEDNAQITKDNKKYKINAGLKNYELKIGNSGSQIIFKSNDLYKNTFCFIVFKGGNFLEILPQSAINIDKIFQIEILTGVIKYYENNNQNFSFTGNIVPELENNEKIINIVQNWYNENLKIYIKTQLGSDILENKTILKISKKTLIMLSKIFPGKYEKNLNNLQNYLNILNIDLNEKKEYNENTNTKGNFNNFRGGLKKGIEMID